ncbi:hypothetical protein EVAR_36582_1 [Eumeta japonica]|uniref:Secreted protein n=1 Tax=Eumeta variegata TaxID=151549 RepID=A0A4C1XPN2_EUMVA|nr:hypothetical protein EVAR_36582_1 [Eumeta japonica]
MQAMGAAILVMAALPSAFHFTSTLWPAVMRFHARVNLKHGSRLPLVKRGYGLRTPVFGAERVGRFQERHKVAIKRSVDDANFASNPTAIVPVTV